MLPEITNPEIINALREHREDREALLAALITSLQSDERVRAAWLWGSFGRGEADDLSDLDSWIVVADAYVGEMGASLRFYAKQAGSFITGGEAPQNGPPGGGFFSSLHVGRHGLLHMDCYWQPLSMVEGVPERAVLFDRRQQSMTGPLPVLPSQEARVALSEQEERIVDGIGFAWMMLSITAKTLARHPDSDLGLMYYPRPGLEEAARLLGQEGLLEASDWTAPANPLEKVERLRLLAEKTGRLTEAANSRGLELSSSNALCLNRYLALVESILSLKAL